MSNSIEHKPYIQLHPLDKSEEREIPEGHFQLELFDPTRGVALFKGHDGTYICHREGMSGHEEYFAPTSNAAEDQTPKYVQKYLLRPVVPARDQHPLMWQGFDSPPQFVCEKNKIFSSAADAIRYVAIETTKNSLKYLEEKIAKDLKTFEIEPTEFEQDLDDLRAALGYYETHE